MIIEYVQDKQCILLKINIRASDVQTFTYALNYATKILRKIDQIYFERGFYESELLISGRSNDVENLSSYRYIFVFAMEKLVFENGIDDMRSRDLRSLLVQKLGVDLNLVNKILDRNELKELVKTILHEKIKQKTNEEYTALAYQVSIVVGILTILYLCRNIIWGFMLSLKDILGESTYKSAKKGKLLIYLSLIHI